MDADGDDQAVAQADGVLDHVQMAVGDGVKRAGIKRDTGHRIRPNPPRAARQAGLGFTSAFRRRLLFRIGHMNQFRARGVS